MSMSDPTVPLLDEHGTSLGEVPAFVTDATLERWLVCAIIATRMTGTPHGHPENSLLATWLYDNAQEGSERVTLADLDEAAGPGELELREALEEARAAPARRQWRNRLGEWIDMPDVPKPPPRIRTPPPLSPGTLYTPEQIREAGLDKWPEKGPEALALLGDARDTAEIHSVGEPASPGTGLLDVPYSPRRSALHDEIIAKFKEGKKPAPGTARAVFTAGGSASGKSTTLKANTPPEVAEEQSILPAEVNTVHIDPDRIKELMPEYQQLRAKGDHYAAQAVHVESGDIAARLLLEAMEEGFHVVIDGTGNSDPGDFTRQLEHARDRGYEVDVLYVNAPTDVAISWAIKRAEETGRYVPVPKIREIHAKVSRNFANEVVGLDWLGKLEIFDQGDHIATWAEGKLQILDRTKFVAFVNKQEEARRGPARA